MPSTLFFSGLDQMHVTIYGWLCSCGLWLLFHSLSVRVSDKESNAALRAIHTFVENFFNCQECREHFLEMSSRWVLPLNVVVF